MITGPRTASRVRKADRGTALDMVTERLVRYTIYNLERPAFSDDEPTLARIIEGRSVIVAIDDVVYTRFGGMIDRYFGRNARVIATEILSGREEDKEWEAVERICRTAVHSGLDRNGMIVAIGGGVVLDIAGVAASLFRRGVRYVRVPTTLIGAVDVAVGIKQAFNFSGKKSALGAFYPPVAAVVDRGFLASLDARALACGVAEIAKVALVRDATLFEMLESYGEELLGSRFQEPAETAQEIIVRAQAAMMDDLEPNLYEDCLSRLVDFGHTFSPALEAASDYRIPHGEAVAVDMVLSLAIGVLRGLCCGELLERVLCLYRRVNLPSTHELITVNLLQRALCDTRKHRGNTDNFVIPTGIGSATFIDGIETGELANAIAYVNDCL